MYTNNIGSRFERDGLSYLLSLVCVENPELPSGEVIGQWLALIKGIGGGRLHTACCMGG